MYFSFSKKFRSQRLLIFVSPRNNFCLLSRLLIKFGWNKSITAYVKCLEFHRKYIQKTMLDNRIATVRESVQETGKRTKYGYLRPEKFSIYCQVLGLNRLKTGLACIRGWEWMVLSGWTGLSAVVIPIPHWY